jgi:hypothetical protein
MMAVDSGIAVTNYPGQKAVCQPTILIFSVDRELHTMNVPLIISAAKETDSQPHTSQPIKREYTILHTLLRNCIHSSLKGMSCVSM